MELLAGPVCLDASDTCVATRHCMLLKTAEVYRTYSKCAHAIEFHTLDSSAHATRITYDYDSDQSDALSRSCGLTAAIAHSSVGAGFAES